MSSNADPQAEASDPAVLRRADWTRSAEPLFLIGSPRSGTTWLQSLLAAHPAIHTGPETHFFDVLQPVQRAFWDGRPFLIGLAAYLDGRQFYTLAAEMFWKTVSCLPDPEGEPRYFLEKSPHHCRASELILNCFPNARFLHLVRDPRAVVASLLRVSSSWAAAWAPAEVTAAARSWIENVEVSRRIALTVPESQFTEVRYEDLRAAPEEHLPRLWQWLGLDAPAELVAEAVRANQLPQARGSDWPFPGIPQPGPAPATGHQVAYPADFIGRAPARAEDVDLPADARARVEEMTAPLLEAYGYPLSSAPSEPRSAAEPAGPAAPGKRRFGASVIVCAEGDDPTLILETLEAMGDDWRDDWELVLVPQSGSACQTVAAALSGDFQLVEPEGPLEYGEALQQGAVAARARNLIVPTERGLFWIARGAVIELGGARGVDRERILAWLQWRGDERPDLLPTRLAEARAAAG